MKPQNGDILRRIRGANICGIEESESNFLKDRLSGGEGGI